MHRPQRLHFASPTCSRHLVITEPPDSLLFSPRQQFSLLPPESSTAVIIRLCCALVITLTKKKKIVSVYKLPTSALKASGVVSGPRGWGIVPPYPSSAFLLSYESRDDPAMTLAVGSAETSVTHLCLFVTSLLFYFQYELVILFI